ncbi:hypothetical protein Lokhon_02985 [Limimaricola hongkongensis DSM 17492]|uniref:Uncharacterized protein n=1 Tax=Limimaricola hongkongensis DSM 17492 TaxID=1122180 RepID=A0A017H9Z9_9RHOB|nr:hypothetical protein Lokhon_02985 [Limimaricola hongkongensis DSM 17492]
MSRVNSGAWRHCAARMIKALLTFLSGPLSERQLAAFDRSRFEPGPV